MSTEADTCREYVVPKLQAAGWENVAEIIGKFGGADQLRNAVINCNCWCMQHDQPSYMKII